MRVQMRNLVCSFFLILQAACTTILASDPHATREHVSSPAIWFGPMQDHFDAVSHAVSWSYYDFPALLLPDASWQKAAHGVDALVFNSTHIVESISQTGAPSLPAIHAMLDRLGVKSAGGGAVIYTDGKCKTNGTEGITDDTGFAREAYYTTKAWHDAGMPMSYFVMDSPFYYGYKFSFSRCRFTIDEVARRAATTMKMIRRLYPNIVIIDAEGPGKELLSNWLSDYHRFLSAFRSAYGAPIQYLDMDLHWDDTWHTGYNWVTAALEIVKSMHAAGIRVSLIVDAEDQRSDPDLPGSITDASGLSLEYWMAAVRHHVDLIKQNAIPLDAVDIESWMKFPKRNLPENDKDAWTSIVDYALDVLNNSDSPARSLSQSGYK